MIRVSIMKSKYSDTLTTAGTEYVRIGLPSKACKKWGFMDKDAISVSIEGDHILRLKYIGAVKSCSRESSTVKLRTAGSFGIVVSAKKLPQLCNNYDIPNKVVHLEGVPIDGDLCIDISSLKKQQKPKDFSVVADEASQQEKPKRKLGFF